MLQVMNLSLMHNVTCTNFDRKATLSEITFSVSLVSLQDRLQYLLQQTLRLLPYPRMCLTNL